MTSSWVCHSDYGCPFGLLLFVLSAFYIHSINFNTCWIELYDDWWPCEQLNHNKHVTYPVFNHKGKLHNEKNRLLFGIPGYTRKWNCYNEHKGADDISDAFLKVDIGILIDISLQFAPKGQLTLSVSSYSRDLAPNRQQAPISTNCDSVRTGFYAKPINWLKVNYFVCLSHISNRSTLFYTGAVPHKAPI